MEDRLELIAERQQGAGDKWKIINTRVDSETIYDSLTETMEAYFQKTNWTGDFYISPRNSKLYIVKDIEETPPEPVKKFNIYGE